MTRTTTKPMTAMSVALLPRAGGSTAASAAGLEAGRVAPAGRAAAAEDEGFGAGDSVFHGVVRQRGQPAPSLWTTGGSGGRAGARTSGQPRQRQPARDCF